MKKTLSIAVIIMLMFILTGCRNTKDQNANTTTEKTYTSQSENTNTNNDNNTNTKEEENILEEIDYAKSAEKQMAKPEKGEQIAIFYIKNYGQVKVKFFPEIAPKAVENFVTHAKNGYYNDVTFHRVINEFMIQGGDPEGTGRGGESIWGKGFGTEFGDYSLVPYRGTLCMAMSSAPNSIGSQFFITQANYDKKVEENMLKQGFPSGVIEQYKTHGGAMHLYLQYTVFGQVFEGMDIIDKIAVVKTVAGDKPDVDVIIEKIEITTY